MANVADWARAFGQEEIPSEYRATDSSASTKKTNPN
jgi:hypothetical protein